MSNKKWHPFLLHSDTINTTICVLFILLFQCITIPLISLTGIQHLLLYYVAYVQHILDTTANASMRLTLYYAPQYIMVHIPYMTQEQNLVGLLWMTSADTKALLTDNKFNCDQSQTAQRSGGYTPAFKEYAGHSCRAPAGTLVLIRAIQRTNYCWVFFL